MPIHPEPKRQGAVEIDVLFIVFVLRLRLGVGLVDDHSLKIENEDAPRIAPRRGDAFADCRDGLLQYGLRWRRNEDAFGMLAGETAARATMRPLDRAPASVAATVRSDGRREP